MTDISYIMGNLIFLFGLLNTHHSEASRKTRPFFHNEKSCRLYNIGHFTYIMRASGIIMMQLLYQKNEMCQFNFRLVISSKALIRMHLHATEWLIWFNYRSSATLLILGLEYVCVYLNVISIWRKLMATRFRLSQMMHISNNSIIFICDVNRIFN